MSLKALTWAFEVDLPMATKFVLVALSNHADDGGACWPSQGALAKETGQTDRSVRNQLNKLENLGFISRQKRRRGNGSYTSDMFVLNWDEWPTAINAAANHRNDVPVASSPQEPRSAGGRNVVPVPAERRSGAIEEPPINLQLNQTRARGGGGSATGARRPQGAAPDATEATEPADRGPFPRKDPPLWQRLIADWVACQPSSKWTDAMLRAVFRGATGQPTPNQTMVMRLKLLAKEAGAVSELPDELIVGFLDAKDHHTGVWLVSDDVLAQRGLTRPEAPP